MIKVFQLAANSIISLSVCCSAEIYPSHIWLQTNRPNSALLCNVSNLVQVVGQTAVEALHSLLLVGAIAVQAIKLEADGPVEILADGS